jgi:hypothetical protein
MFQNTTPQFSIITLVRDAPFFFNVIIDSFDLREIAIFGRQFTWVSRWEVPTYQKLDRVLDNTDWKHTFPLVHVCALTRRGENIPNYLPIQVICSPCNMNHFIFELSWMHQDGFYDMIKNEWEVIQTWKSHAQRCKHKIRHLKQFYKGGIFF